MCMQIQLNFNINKSRVLPQNCTCYNASAECLYYYSVTWICNHIAQCVENAFNASHATNKQYFTNPQEATISIRRKNVTNIKSHSFFGNLAKKFQFIIRWKSRSTQSSCKKTDSHINAITCFFFFLNIKTLLWWCHIMTFGRRGLSLSMCLAKYVL